MAMITFMLHFEMLKMSIANFTAHKINHRNERLIDKAQTSLTNAYWIYSSSTLVFDWQMLYTSVEEDIHCDVNLHASKSLWELNHGVLRLEASSSHFPVDLWWAYVRIINANYLLITVIRAAAVGSSSCSEERNWCALKCVCATSVSMHLDFEKDPA